MKIDINNEDIYREDDGEKNQPRKKHIPKPKRSKGNWRKGGKKSSDYGDDEY